MAQAREEQDEWSHKGASVAAHATQTGVGADMLTMWAVVLHHFAASCGIILSLAGRQNSLGSSRTDRTSSKHG